MEPRTRIVDVSERRPFRTIYEAINWYVGTNYSYWGRACWPNGRPNDGFRMWFTQLAYVEKGRYVPATYDCINLICCNGNYHVFDKVNPKEPDVMATQTWKYDLIFSKEVGGFYYFRGVFISDTEHSTMHHYVSKRIATKAKLIGCPARRLELLDSIDPGEFDEDYLKKQFVSYDVVDVGTGFQPGNNNTKQVAPRVQEQVKKPATKEPAKLSDEECLKLFPVDCSVYHKTFGSGTVLKNNNGIVTIRFEKGVVKELGVDFCVKNKLLEIK